MTTHGPASCGPCVACGRGRRAIDADVATLPDDPACLKYVIGELQFEVDLMRDIIELGGGASELLGRDGRI